MNGYHPNRVNEAKTAPFRSDRFFCVDGEWFFAVRRGPDMGPYDSMDEARVALKAFIEEQLLQERRHQAEQHVLHRGLKPIHQRLR